MRTIPEARSFTQGQKKLVARLFFVSISTGKISFDKDYPVDEIPWQELRLWQSQYNIIARIREDA